jgi:hypothetical protein
MTKHFVIDFETLGQRTRTCPVISCAYYTFEWDRFLSNNPYTFQELISNIVVDKLEVASQIEELGYVVEKSTVEFWQAQSKEVRAQAIPSKRDIHVRRLIENIVQYLYGEKTHRWWSRSNTFDPIILTRIAEDLNAVDELNRLLPYYKVRDTRTYIDAKFDFQIKKNAFIPHPDEAYWNSIFKEHDPVHDVAADILRLQRIARIENELEV